MPFLSLKAVQQEPKGPNSDVPMYWIFQELKRLTRNKSSPCRWDFGRGKASHRVSLLLRRNAASQLS
jgi:hypothetical protein